VSALITAGRNGATSQQPETGNQLWPELETALRRSQDYLLSIQKPEGYWVGELMVIPPWFPTRWLIITGTAEWIANGSARRSITCFDAVAGRRLEHYYGGPQK